MEMHRKNFMIWLLFPWMLFSCGKETGGGKVTGGYVEIYGVKLYYETAGSGPPLLYLHGGLSSGKDFSKYVPELSKDFKVITVDRRGHGRSYDDDRPYSYSSMADQMNSFLERMGIRKASVIGWSDGGVVGYHLAGRYPSRVTRLAAFGANTLVGGMTESSIEWIKTQLTPDNIDQAIPSIGNEYRRSNPQPGNFSNFIVKTREMWLRDPYISKEDFQKISVPVLLVAGDRDDIRLEHMIEMHSLLKASQLCILPNTTHFVFEQRNETVIRILLEFLRQDAGR